MLAKRIIPCLDVDGGRVVKGVKFANLRDAGDPVELGKFYTEEDADELVFLDITASYEKRKTMIDVVQKVARHVFIPFAVGGGIRSVDDMRSVLLAGADKIAINTAAVENPSLISKGANIFGCQCIVLALDAKRAGKSWEVYIGGGRIPTRRDALQWARETVRRGAGEILLTSMDRDGTKVGFDIELTKRVSEAVSVPVISSGGAGSPSDFLRVFRAGKADAALAASIFHFGELRINDVKKILADRDIPIRQTGSADGLTPAIVQDATTGEVLMLAYMNQTALQRTQETGYVHFWSRSRDRLWKKGEASGNVLKVETIYTDCDDDSYLVKARLIGQAVCHTGKKSCFTNTLVNKYEN